MKGMKKFLGVITGCALVMSATFFASCSTAPVAPLATNQVNYTILGPVDGGPWMSQSAALTAARQTYANADAVIAITAKGKDNLIPWNVKLGYYAIKFNQQVEPSAKKGLFG
jgi:hypothetical protein